MFCQTQDIAPQCDFVAASGENTLRINQDKTEAVRETTKDVALRWLALGFTTPCTAEQKYAQAITCPDPSTLPLPPARMLRRDKFYG